MVSIIERIEAEHRTLQEQHQVRILSLPHGIDFCSNDYLSLSSHPSIIDAVKMSVDEEGYGASSSRFIRGERRRYQAVEKQLARFKQCESALIFSSGYAANVGVLSSLIKKEDVVFSDELNHASIIDGLRLSGAQICIFPHGDTAAVTTWLKNTPHVQKFLVTESLFSMDGDSAPLKDYAQLAQAHNMGLIVDESHAVGLYGPKGAGLVNQLGLQNEVMLSINGLGKAFGCYGAFVAGKKLIIDYLLQKTRTLMFTTALPPLAIAAIEAALGIIENGDDLRKTLFHHVSLLDEGLSSCGLPYRAKTPIIPLIVGDNERTAHIASGLKKAGFDVKAIRPPTVALGKARLRITANVSHNQELIETFIKELRQLI